MFFYTHVVSQDFAAESTTSVFEDWQNTENFPTQTTYSATTYHVTKSGEISVSDTYADNLGFYKSGYEKTSYAFGTASRSVTARTASSSISTYRNDIAPFTLVNTSTSSTFTIGPAGSSTGVDSITFTARGTTTTQFTQNFATAGASIISGTASATTTITGSTRTLTLSNATTLVPLFVLSMPTVRRWYEARSNPPILRGAGIAFAATHTAATSAVQGLAAGTNSYASDLSFGSSSSSSDNGFVYPFDGTAEISHEAKSGHTFFTGSKISTTAWRATGLLGAIRRQLVGPAFISQTGIGSDMTFSPSITATWTGGVSVAQGIQSANIFTNNRVHASTTFRWKHESSSWRLHATSSNTSTTSSYTVAVGISGSASTEAFLALNIIGATTAILGPAHPFTALSLNELSVSTLLSDTSGVSAYYSSRNASSAGSSSTFVTASSSATTQIGSGSGFAPATFADSLLTWAVAQVAVSVQASTWSKSFDGEGSIPSIYRASKWNEAGRGDAVSVDQ
jgi:hypothetical protein